MANFDRILEETGSLNEAVKYANAQGVTVRVDTYYNMTHGTNKVNGQAHHLNQDAAFGKKTQVILRDDGLCVELTGNAFSDIGTQHYNAHETMEKFWNQYRKGGSKEGQAVSLDDYNRALLKSLKDANLSDLDAAYATARAMGQQRDNPKVKKDVPKLPGKVNQKKR